MEIKLEEFDYDKKEQSNTNAIALSRIDVHTKERNQHSPHKIIWKNSIIDFSDRKSDNASLYNIIIPLMICI